MESKREQALVGLFVLVAAALLVVTVALLSGTTKSGYVSYRAYFKNAGGLGPGAEVRYAGGPSVGRVSKVRSDPQDPTRMEIEFSIDPHVPVKTDSTAEITSTSPLGDNFLGINPGSRAAPTAPAGSTLKGVDYTSLDDIKATIAQLGPHATELIDNLNDRVVALKETMDRVNDLINAQNRANLSATLANVRGMLEEDRPAIHSTLENVNASSAKLGPLIDDFRKTSAQANDALAHIDAMVAEDRPDVHEAVGSLRKALASAVSLTDQLDRTMSANSENLDEIIENLRHVTANLNSFTETIKTRPYTLIRSSGVKPREPGQAMPQ
ncbi:MAG TPA: MlaD family protein [Candidatus Acidoferrum sp.]|nr:MlaD family protein [Candidatus Acidoferrum sp.]